MSTYKFIIYPQPQPISGYQYIHPTLDQARIYVERMVKENPHHYQNFHPISVIKANGGQLIRGWIFDGKSWSKKT